MLSGATDGEIPRIHDAFVDKLISNIAKREERGARAGRRGDGKRASERKARGRREAKGTGRSRGGRSERGMATGVGEIREPGDRSRGGGRRRQK